jgi:hypothetical protein
MLRTPDQYTSAHEKSKIDEPISCKKAKYPIFLQKPFQYSGADLLGRRGR